MEKRSDIEDDECPTNSFESGPPSGTCWGDGHYNCRNCKHYREDFARVGQPLIDAAHHVQGMITISPLQPSNR